MSSRNAANAYVRPAELRRPFIRTPSVTPATAGTPSRRASTGRTLPSAACVAAPHAAMGTMAASDVAVAARGPYPHHSTSSGTMITPPPTPNSAEKPPASAPIATSAHGERLVASLTVEIPADARRLLDALAADPARAALLLDFDGTLAPIVSRPQDARLLDGARELIEALRDRLGVVAFISGRGLRDVRERVGVPGLAYAGNHGMEIQRVGEEPAVAEAVSAWRPALDEYAAGQAADPAAVPGVEIEDKGATLSVHWRNAPDPGAAHAWLEGPRAAAARDAGLAVTWGRMVMEVRPPTAIDKGTAARELVAAAGARAALHIGDDWYCTEDVCTHDGQPLTDGPVADCQITCPRHGAMFDVRTGKATKMPAIEPIRTFPVTIRDGDVFVEVE